MYAKHCFLLIILVQISCTKKVCDKDEGTCEYYLEVDYATVDEFPHAVAIFETATKNYICGGSVLSAKVVLTAAHCLLIQPNPEAAPTGVHKSLYVAAGSDDLAKALQKRDVKTPIPHECYDWETSHNDIGLLVLVKGFDLGVIKKVTIGAVANEEKTANVSGWGVTNKPVPVIRKSVLKYTELKLYSQQKCCVIFLHESLKLRSLVTFYDGQMCAGDRKAIEAQNKRSFGDSGGALMVSRSEQIGVLSRGTKKRPGVAVFTNVSHYEDWIKKKVGRLLN